MSGEVRLVSAAIKAQNPDLETAWRTIAWWEQTCNYWREQAEDARTRLAAVPVPSDTGLAAEVEALADEWFEGDAGIEHVVGCQEFGCKDCVVIACASDLRALLSERTATTGGGGS